MTSLSSDQRTPIARIQPLAKIAAALVLGVALLLSLDPVSATVALALETVLMPAAGLSWRRFWTRTAPVWIAAPLVAITIALYGNVAGHVWFHWALIEVSAGSIVTGVSSGLRILAIALPAVALFATVDATELADGLGQLLHLPARFVLGALAAVRLIGLLGEDWRSLELARRARGIGDGMRIRRFGGQAFALLVLALRRGSDLATAMEGRGFGAPIRRTWARPASFGRREVALVLIAAGVAATAITVSVVTGHWRATGG